MGWLPLQSIKGIGPKLTERLQGMGIRTQEDFLFHLPTRYQDRTRNVAIHCLAPGDEAQILAEVVDSEIRHGRRRSLLVRLHDGHGYIYLRFFHFSAAQRRQFARSTRVRCFGEVRVGPNGLEMVHPEYQICRAGETPAVEEHYTPIYPLTDGIAQAQMRKLVADALDVGIRRGEAQELLPSEVLERYELPGLTDTLNLLHRPPPSIKSSEIEATTASARRRLAFEELLAQQIALRDNKQRGQSGIAPRLVGTGQLTGPFLESLPFDLTAAQQRVIDEIEQDLRQAIPMQRLVQGDVGSGKTVVAAMSALVAVESSYQVAIMAPTELLAEQHLRSFSNWMDPLDIKVDWLAGNLNARARRSALENIITGYAKICVGTHALFQQSVQFRNLGLIIIDEQHRFGVGQRLALRNKGNLLGTTTADGAEHSPARFPHQLVMTATPIPRTLAMTAYADMEHSIIDALPPGRKPIQTAVVPDTRRAEVVSRIEKACAGGQQAYWVCTLIDDSEKLKAQAASATADDLRRLLPDLEIGLVHGRLSGEEKEQIMRAFAEQRIDLLVATTVIEVGVDVPNATLMIIENAERLGLAQLHQLRGRVGRGERASFCLLMYTPPLSEHSRARLEVLRESNDGFVIAERDLELRGPGEFLGTRQTGLGKLRVANLIRDAEMIPNAAALANQLVKEDPALAAKLTERWIGTGKDFVNA